MASEVHQSVLDHFLEYTGKFEGVAVPHMYVDVIGLVTVAYGNLIDGSQSGTSTPWLPALALPWRTPEGKLADKAQVTAEWQKLKGAEAGLRRRSLAVQATYTTVRLTPDDCAALVFAKVDEIVAYIIAHHFPDFGTYPADAQLAILSLAWAAGADWPRKFPHCKAAILVRNWSLAVLEGVLSTIAADGKTPNPGVIPRNKAQRLLFANAAGVDFAHLDPSVLHWPLDAGDGTPLYT